ncbi:DUF1850 domain-containing protein [Virgibacillus dakarensis]|nr:DUF1850 domain-containing protein [Virgibacillus dakarensis]
MLKNIIIYCGLVLIVAGILMVPVQSGLLLTNNKGNSLYFFPWDKDEDVTIGWRHSVELTPWEETYMITKTGELLLKSTTYKSYGAGTPDTDGKVEFLANEFVRVTGIERTIPYYSLFYVPMSNYYLEQQAKKYPLSQVVPDNINVQIHYKVVSMYEWLWLKIK